MASNEVSKLVWVGIVVALAGGLYGAAKPQVDTIATDTFSKVHQFVNNSQGFNLEPSVPKPDETDSKWTVKSNYGENGRFVMDKDGNAVVYAIDETKPILLKYGTINLTSNNDQLKTLTFRDNGSFDFTGQLNNNVNLTKIEGLTRLDTSKMTSMSFMFRGNSSLTTLDVSKFNTSNVTDMSYMFDGNRSLTALDVSNWDTSKVTDMGNMFYTTESLKTLDVSKWNVSNVTSMAYMFNYDSALTALDVSKWDVSKVTHMSGMFGGNYALTALDVSKWNVSNVTSMAYMFVNDTSLKTLDVSKWDISKVTNMTGMFAGSSVNPLPAWYHV